MTFLACRCPQCDQGALFRHFLLFLDHCPHCQLPYHKADAADGPSYVVSCLVMTLQVVMLWFTDFGSALSHWFQLLIWIVTTIILSLWLLRYTKSMFIHIQFHTRPETFQ